MRMRTRCTRRTRTNQKDEDSRQAGTRKMGLRIVYPESQQVSAFNKRGFDHSLSFP